MSISTLTFKTFVRYSRDMRRRIVTQPSCPENILMHAFPIYLDEVLSNPVVDLILLGNPFWFTTFPFHIVEQLGECAVFKTRFLHTPRTTWTKTVVEEPACNRGLGLFPTLREYPSGLVMAETRPGVEFCYPSLKRLANRVHHAAWSQISYAYASNAHNAI